MQPLRRPAGRVGKPARGKTARRNDPDQTALVSPAAQRQQARRGRIDQLVVVERAVGAGDAVESLVRRAERMRQRREIGFLGYGVGANEHALGADADRACTAFRGSNDAAGQEMTNAIEFGTRARARYRRLVTGGSRNRDLRDKSPQRFVAKPTIRPNIRHLAAD
jgi:hypothetical protein